MKWHLDIQIDKYPFEIHLHDKIFLMGSCFAENLAIWLKERYFNIFSNPNGVLFNPISIFNVLNNIIQHPDTFDEKFLFNDNGQWKSFLHQTYFFNENKDELKQELINTQKNAHQFLKSSQYLFITFGSAFIYEHKELKEVVSNCHQLPSNVFERKLLSVEQIVKHFNELIIELKKMNPDIKIVFSVSPVKYLAYGAINNNLSKSTLLLAVHQLCLHNDNAFYFPAYELITDDLRDYRFFKDDLAHPNEMAVEYVMQKFYESMLSNNTQSIIKRLEKIIAAQKHQIKNIYSQQTQNFARRMLDECITLEKEFPYLNLSDKKRYFEQLIQR
ncbi:MAG: GSCFA domain-containing protein [Bacteroidia bacterium]